jgi:hypothetical protein
VSVGNELLSWLSLIVIFFATANDFVAFVADYYSQPCHHINIQQGSSIIICHADMMKELQLDFLID